MKKLTLRELFAIAEAKNKQESIFAKAGKKVELEPCEIDYIKECKAKIGSQIDQLLEVEIDVDDTQKIESLQKAVKEAQFNEKLLEQVITGGEIKRGITQLKAMGTFNFDSIFGDTEEVVEEIVEEEIVIEEEVIIENETAEVL